MQKRRFDRRADDRRPEVEKPQRTGRERSGLATPFEASRLHFVPLDATLRRAGAETIVAGRFD